MKKIYALVMMVISLMMLSSMTVLAGNKSNEIKVIVNNLEIKYTVKPYEKKDEIMIPVRETAKILGAKVKWDNKNKTVWVNLDMMQIELPLGKSELYIHRDADFSGIPQTVKLNTPIVSVKGKTYVPCKQLFESLGMKVSWDSKLRILSITTQGSDEDDLSQPIPFTEITQDDILKIEKVYQWYQDKAKNAGIHYKKHEGTMYVLIGAGKKPTGGYTMGVSSITCDSATKAYVTVYVKRPAPDMMVTQVETYPHMLIKIDVTKNLKSVIGDVQEINHDAIPTKVVYEEIYFEDIKDNDILEKWYDENKEKKGISYLRDGKFMYALIGGGDKPTGGYSIKLDEIYYSSNDTISLSATVNPPGDNVRVMMVITYPSMLIRIESDSVLKVIGDVIDK